MLKKNNVEKVLKNWGKEYKKGFIGYFILLFLKERSMYGFEINKQLMEVTNSRVMYQESGIYQILKNLELHAMISSQWQKSSMGPPRKCYNIEEAGKELLELFTRDYLLPMLDTATHLVKKHYPGLKTKSDRYKNIDSSIKK